MGAICLNNIVTVRDLCKNEFTKPTSGYDLMDAPEINRAILGQLAGGEYVQGLGLLKDCIKYALRDISTDLVGVLAANKYAANITAENISTGSFDGGLTNGNVNLERGLTIFRNPSKGIKKLKIKEIHIFPINSVSSIDLKFYDSGFVSTIPVQLVGGQINKFNIDYTVNGDFVKILLNNSQVQTYSSKLTCMTTCNGALPNDCGYVMGYNGNTEIQKEGFGINAVFSCECDFDQLLCNFSNSYIGKIVWTKARVYALEERLRSNRLTNFLIYNRDEVNTFRIELENEYRSLWNGFVMALPNLLKYSKDDCITCKGVQIVTNV